MKRLDPRAESAGTSIQRQGVNQAQGRRRTWFRSLPDYRPRDQGGEPGSNPPCGGMLGQLPAGRGLRFGGLLPRRPRTIEVRYYRMSAFRRTRLSQLPWTSLELSNVPVSSPRQLVPVL